MHSCGPADAGSVNHVFAARGVFGINPSDWCGRRRGLRLRATGNVVGHGQSAQWQASAPPGLQIDAFFVPPHQLDEFGVNAGADGFYRGGFYWAGGSQPIANRRVQSAVYAVSGLGSSYLGFRLTCDGSPCRGQRGVVQLGVKDIVLQVRDTSGPYLTAGGGLWAASGWVRGDWPLSFTGDSPSGVCALSARIDGQTVSTQRFRANRTLWHQCAATGLQTTVHTTKYANGANALALRGRDAAQLATSDAPYTKAVDFDNQPPTVALTGPSDAPSNAGTQHLRVTATAGPSGIARITCTVDGQLKSYAGTSARIAVSGIGVHNVHCSTANNARDASGAVAVSLPAGHRISIRRPTLLAVGFGRIVGALRCGTVRAPVEVPGRTMSVRRHHKLVRVHGPGHTTLVRVTRCRGRIEVKRVPMLVTVTRHGRHVRVKHYKRVPVIATPHQATRTTQLVAYGHTTTVSGVLLANDGTPLAGQTVQLLTAPDNGHGQFTPAAVARTTANGDWSTRLPAGPSRRVRALYGGGRLTERSASAQLGVIVPASVSLDVAPRHTHWGATVSVSGRLHSGYIPAGGELVVFRASYPSGSSKIGHVYTGADGRFVTRFTFLHGYGSASYQFWASTASQSDYPFAPGTSEKIAVFVSP